MTDTRTSEALSDVDWLRELAAQRYAKISVLERQRLLAIATAYADLSHLCANYKAESEKQTAECERHQKFWQARGERLEADVATKDERIRQLEALVGDIAEQDRAFPANPLEISAWTRKLIDICSRAETLAVPQEGNT